VEEVPWPPAKTGKNKCGPNGPAIWGDPVEVSGTSVTLGPDDGDIYIWALSWDQWKAQSVG
jgi:hypothetical protein